MQNLTVHATKHLPQTLKPSLVILSIKPTKQQTFPTISFCISNKAIHSSPTDTRSSRLFNHLFTKKRLPPLPSLLQIFFSQLFHSLTIANVSWYGGTNAEYENGSEIQKTQNRMPLFCSFWARVYPLGTTGYYSSFSTVKNTLSLPNINTTTLFIIQLVDTIVKSSPLFATSTGAFFTIQLAETSVETLDNQFFLFSIHSKLQAMLPQSLLVNTHYTSSKWLPYPPDSALTPACISADGALSKCLLTWYTSTSFKNSL